MRVKAVIAARMGSTRLERKMLRDLHGIPLLGHSVRRALWLPEITETEDIVLAIPESPENDVLAEFGHMLDLNVFRGSEENVLSRIIGAADIVNADVIYRITPDNPLIDPGVVTETFREFNSGVWDYAAMEDTPLGTAAEIVRVSALKEAQNLAAESGNEKFLEHPTLALYDNSDLFRMKLIPCPEKWQRPGWRFTVDTEADFSFVKSIMDELGIDATLDTIVPFIDSNPELLEINAGISQKGWDSLKERKDSIRNV